MFVQRNNKVPKIHGPAGPRVIARRLDTVGVMPTMLWIFLLAAYHWQDGYNTLTTVLLLLLRCIGCESFFTDGACLHHFRHNTDIICLSMVS